MVCVAKPLAKSYTQTFGKCFQESRRSAKSLGLSARRLNLMLYTTPCGQSITDHPPEIQDSMNCKVCNLQQTKVYRPTPELTRCTPYALEDLVISLSALHVLLESCYEIEAGALGVNIAGSAQFSNLIIFLTNSKHTIYWTLSYPSNPESFITRQHHLLICQLINQMVISSRFTSNPGCPAFVAWSYSERVVRTAYKM